MGGINHQNWVVYDIAIPTFQSIQHELSQHEHKSHLMYEIQSTVTQTQFLNDVALQKGEQYPPDQYPRNPS